MLLFGISVVAKKFFLSWCAVGLVVILAEIWQKSVIVNIPGDILS